MSVLPVYNTIILPGSTVWLRASTYREQTGRAPAAGDRVTFLIQKEDGRRSALTPDSFYPIGAAGTVREADLNGFTSIQVLNRVNIEEAAILRDRSISLTVTRRADIDDLDREDAGRRLTEIKDRLLAFSRGKPWSEAMRSFAARWETLWDVASALSPHIRVSNEDRYALLAADSLQARFDAAERLILENLELITVQDAARSAQEEDHQRLYRESALRKQIDFLQKELDGMHPENVSDLRRLELKLEQAGMNEAALREGRRVLNRIRAENGSGPEAGMLTDWLELLCDLPWKKEPASRISMADARAALDADHSGLEKVKSRILQQIAVMHLKGKQSGSILCFVGAPGTGKTSIGRSIAEALGRKYARVSLGGVRDEADIRGHRRTYIGAMPGRIIDSIHKSGVSNPVMVLDEVDKLSASLNGDPTAALLEVLDPEQNASFTDHYLNVPFDLSDVLFICTANTLDTIPQPLLDRMEVVRFPGYTPLEKAEIARDHLFPRAAEAAGLSEAALTLTDGALDAIISEYTREAGVRGLKKCLDRLCRSAAVRLVEDPGTRLTVDADSLRELLDMDPLHRRTVPAAARPGIVTGLAWTPVGGEILYIQTLLTPGSGKVTVTGQLGDVMQESSRIAVSLVRSLLPGRAAALDQGDLHIHVPDGATPKDGPSAGITLTTALASLLTGTGIPPSVAMTGEVSLCGDVGPIGGLPEKLMAAQRAGVRKVFVPAENTDQLKDVAPEVRSSLEIVPVSTVEEVLSALGVPTDFPALTAV